MEHMMTESEHTMDIYVFQRCLEQLLKSAALMDGMIDRERDVLVLWCLTSV